MIFLEYRDTPVFFFFAIKRVSDIILVYVKKGPAVSTILFSSCADESED